MKVFFQQNVQPALALPQISAAADSVLKQLPAGITPPGVLIFNAASVPVLNLALSRRRADGIAAAGLRQQLHPSFDVDHSRRFNSHAVRRHGAPDPDRYRRQLALQSYGLSAQDVAEALASQNLILPVGHTEDR